MGKALMGLTKATGDNLLRKLSDNKLELHANGIVACTALEGLTCMESWVQGTALEKAHLLTNKTRLQT